MDPLVDFCELNGEILLPITSYSSVGEGDNSAPASENADENGQGQDSTLIFHELQPLAVVEIEHTSVEIVTTEEQTILSGTLSDTDLNSETIIIEQSICISQTCEMTTTPAAILSTSGSFQPGRQNNNNNSGIHAESSSFTHEIPGNIGNTSLAQLLGHCSNTGGGLDRQASQLPQPHGFQSQQSHYPGHIAPQQQQQQQHAMENHHHAGHSQQMNMSSSSQHHNNELPYGGHFSHGSNPQNYLPFGVNSANFGNNSNCFMYPPHQSGTNQQHSSRSMMNMNPLQQACFMQHAACLQFQQQQQQQQQSTFVGPQCERATVGWMTGAINASKNVGNSSKSNISLAQAQCGPSSQMPCNRTVNAAPNIHDPNALPGGLEILWRELPPECPKYLTPQDVPDAAKLRGYFTVCELLGLKRTLEARFLGCARAPIPVGMPGIPMATTRPNVINNSNQMMRTGTTKKGSKRSRESKDRGGSPVPKCSKGSQRQSNAKKSSQGGKKGGKESAKEPAKKASENDDISSVGELMIDLESPKGGQDYSNPQTSVTGVGGLVKEAMEALSSSTDPNGLGNASDEVAEQVERGQTDNGTENNGNNLAGASTNDDGFQFAPESSTTDVTGSSINAGDYVASEVEIETEIPGHQRSTNCSTATMEQSHSALTVEHSNGNDNEKQGEFCSQSCISSTTTSCNNTTLSNSNPGCASNVVHLTTPVSPSVVRGTHFCPQMEGRFVSTSPHYRTTTLVLKLLKIGHYHIRSFSSLNPNRFRILFNAQRVTYECQLPIVASSSTANLMRKVLTVDIGFDQIRQLKFGPDFLLMRIEGPPLTTLALASAQDEPTIPNLTPENIMLLQQIENGTLKLSPVHELFFLNERLVQLLESQFREHPLFRYLIM